MGESRAHTISVDFPGDIEYIPSVRKFISSLINTKNFSRRFSFRTEIIIDELCNNAVKFGKLKIGQAINLKCNINDDGVIIDVCNPCADEKDLKRLKKFIAGDSSAGNLEDITVERGIKIIKILCSKIEVNKSDKICVRVIKSKNEMEDLR